MTKHYLFKYFLPAGFACRKISSDGLPFTKNLTDWFMGAPNTATMSNMLIKHPLIFVTSCSGSVDDSIFIPQIVLIRDQLVSIDVGDLV